MTTGRIKRLLTSVFTRLLLTVLAAGMAITVTVIVGFMVIRFQAESAFDRNLLVYVDYLLSDIGDPPKAARAQAIARRTGLVIRFEHPDGGWQTGPLPHRFNLQRAWIHRHPSGIWTGSSKGHHFIRLDHGGGTLLFIAPLDTAQMHYVLWVFAAMLGIMGLILGSAYVYLRKLLKPLRTLKTGVDKVGAGLLEHRIPETGSSELRDLARAFNTMAGRLAQLLRSKEQLLLDVSHELRSPITRLKVQFEFLDDEDARESLRSDVAEMEAMVTALLESARMRHAAAALDRKPTDMAELARSLEADFRNRPPGIRLETLVEEPVAVDPEKMRIVLRNLLDNAVNYTPAGGAAVVLSMALMPDALEIVVADAGEGIPETAIPHLFEPFYRPDTSRSRKTGGFGLGLSLCKAIVDAHGGTIDLVSTLGAGTRVTVRIPRVNAVNG